LAFADEIGTHCIWRPDPAAAFARLDADHDNLRAALGWAAGCDDVTTLCRLAVALRWYWMHQGGLTEGLAWSERAVPASDQVPAPLRAAVLNAAGWLARQQGDPRRAEGHGAQSRALFRGLGDAAGESEALIVLAEAAEDRGEFARARALYEEVLRLVRPLNEPIRTAWAIRHAGNAACLCGDVTAGERLLEEALARFRREGNRHGPAIVLASLGEIALARGEHARAATLWQEWLGLTWDPGGVCASLEGLAEIALACGEAERGARLSGAAEATRERLGAVLVPRRVPEAARRVAAARAALGEAAFAAAWVEGQELTLEEARAEAALVARERQPPAASERGAPGTGGHGLTPREREVVRLVAAGRSNREIADALFVSVPTVKRHLTTVLAKLGLPSRVALAAYAHTHRLA
jgi:DNA-binding CsgD family transcriptional regulator